MLCFVNFSPSGLRQKERMGNRWSQIVNLDVIDAAGVLRYAGAIDDNRDVYKLGETNYVDAALTALLAGGEVASAETRPYGCSVKCAN